MFRKCKLQLQDLTHRSRDVLENVMLGIRHSRMDVEKTFQELYNNATAFTITMHKKDVSKLSWWLQQILL